MGRRVFRALLGVLGVAAGVIVLLGALGAWRTDRDDAGFYSTEAYPFSAESYAVTADYFEVQQESPWMIELLADPADVKIEATSVGDKAIFIGIAPARHVRGYLSDVGHATVTSLEADGDLISDVEYADTVGAAVPLEPGAEDFWAASVQGTGTQTLIWDVALARTIALPEVEEGNWTVLVMNADTSGDVGADLAFGSSYPRVTFLIVLGFLAGVLLLVGGGYLIYRAIRPHHIDPYEARKVKHEESGVDAGFTASQGFNPMHDI